MTENVENKPKLKKKRPPPPLPIGQILNGYQLKKVIGRGGMGTVYLAVHELLGRQAAVKVLSQTLWEDEEFVSRFFHEAKVANNINHPNIVDILDFVHDQNPTRIAYIMELVEGPTLKRILKRHRFNLIQAINITAQLIEALKAAHHAGVIHRDLKPDNILVVEPLHTDLSILPSIKLLDFGIAKITQGPVGHQTMQGAVLGTPKYMAPEQISAEAVSPATDVYALGEIFFELAAGRRVYNGQNNVIMAHKLSGKLPELSCPDDLSGAPAIKKLVSACLALDPAKRIDLDEFAHRLLQIRSAAGVDSDAPLARRRQSVISSRQSASEDEAPPMSPDAQAPQGTQGIIPNYSAPPGPPHGLPQESRPNMLIAAFVVVAVSVLIAGFLVLRSEPKQTRNEVQPTMKAKAKKSVEKKKKTKSKMIFKEIRVSSNPGSATIVEVKTGQQRGTTPALLKIKDKTSTDFTLQHEGYEHLPISLTGNKTEFHFELVPLEFKDTASPPTPAKNTIPAGKKKPINPKPNLAPSPGDDASPMKKKDLPVW